MIPASWRKVGTQTLLGGIELLRTRWTPLDGECRCLRSHEQRAREELAVLLFVEPRALDIEELEARHQTREGERVDRQLRDGLIRTGIRLIVEDMHGAVADLQEVDVPRYRSRRIADLFGALPPAGYAFAYHRAKLELLRRGELDQKREGGLTSTVRFTSLANFLETFRRPVRTISFVATTIQKRAPHKRPLRSPTPAASSSIESRTRQPTLPLSLSRPWATTSCGTRHCKSLCSPTTA